MALRADHVLVLSNTQAEDMIARGVPAEKLTVVPNSVDQELLDLPRAPSRKREQLGLPDGFWVGSVTAIVDYEGLPTLLEAVRILRDQGVPAYAALVGDGVALPSLLERARQLGISDFVVAPGRLPPDEALLWYQALDVFTIPRRDTEVTRSVTPIKGLQAMALGIPLVVSDLPALTEVSSKDGQGVAVAPEDPQALAIALAELYRDEEQRDRMSAAGRSAARSKTWDTAARSVQVAYGHALAAHKQHRRVSTD